MSYTVAVLARDTLARAELSAFLAEEGLFVVAELEPNDDVAVYRDDFELLIWVVDLTDVLDDRASDASVPLLALVEDAEEAAHALRQGAVGILGREVALEHLLAALALLVQGLAVLEPRYLRPALMDDALPLEPLTPRERDVLELLAEGLTNKAIAKRLDISDHTVKFHLNALLSKLAASSRTEAVTQAVRAGLLTL